MPGSRGRPRIRDEEVSFPEMWQENWPLPWLWAEEREKPLRNQNHHWAVCGRGTGILSLKCDKRNLNLSCPQVPAHLSAEPPPRTLTPWGPRTHGRHSVTKDELGQTFSPKHRK